MLSILGYFGLLRREADFTIINPLGISNQLNRLQLHSSNYFNIEEGTVAKGGNCSAVRVVSPFVLSNQSHTNFLNQCTDLVRKKAEQLTTLDKSMLKSLLLGVTASALSFLPLFGWLSWLGWGGVLYYLNQRAIVYNEYQESLNLLVGACNWSLGAAEYQKILRNNASITEMMKVLYPVVSEKQIRHLLTEALANSFVEDLKQYENQFEYRFFSGGRGLNFGRGKNAVEFNRCIYGFNKGYFRDFIAAIQAILPDLYNQAQHSCHEFKAWWQESNSSMLQPEQGLAQGPQQL